MAICSVRHAIFDRVAAIDATVLQGVVETNPSFYRGGLEPEDCIVGNAIFSFLKVVCNVGLAISTSVGALVKNAMPKRVFFFGGLFVLNFVGEGSICDRGDFAYAAS
jgi:hypothetical protein